jgi:hypothetical protein
MLEMPKDLCHESDWAMIADLPEWAQAYAQKWPVPTCQAAMYWTKPPADAFIPQDIEVYLNGLTDPSLVMTFGKIDFCDLAEFSKPQQAIAIEFNSVVRYVEVEGRILLNTVGRIILPECLISASAQAEMLMKLAA